ncbi:MAG TPA: helix-turn-helix domain-containing protein [Candidatus Limnocylindrales bacterium]|nr:helix-turn-helix domain-containing protein [Candidatus Limnocylindrales bacterium]
MENLKDAAGAVGALEDDLRREMYLHVRRARTPVSREEIADALGISRKLAAFHLDKLVERGLLSATYARPPGRGGRGAGRSAKYYAPSSREVDVTIPERHYDLMGTILVRAIDDQQPGEATAATAKRVARAIGEDMGRRERERRRLPRPGAERAMSVASEVLSSCGYEAYRDDGTVRLRNCPFHALAQQSRDLVCGLNRELVQGVVSGLGNDTLDVALAPLPDGCCVQLRPPNRKAPEDEDERAER